MRWTTILEEKPAHNAWRLNGYATIHVAGFPMRAAAGQFVTYAELLRTSSDLKFAPYTETPRARHNPDENMFIEDETKFVYPEKNIIAWMPEVAPYELKSNEETCCTCGRLFIRYEGEQGRCKDCQERYDSFDKHIKKLFEIEKHEDEFISRFSQ